MHKAADLVNQSELLFPQALLFLGQTGVFTLAICVNFRHFYANYMHVSAFFSANLSEAESTFAGLPPHSVIPWFTQLPIVFVQKF